MEITIDAAELIGFADAMAQAPGRLDAEMQTARDVVLTEGVGYAAENAPIDTGALAGSITILSRDGWGGTYGTNLVYAWMREEGGTIHGNPFLVFEWNGRLIFARQVTQEGSHYMAKSAEQLEGRVEPIYGAAVERVLGGI